LPIAGAHRPSFARDPAGTRNHHREGGVINDGFDTELDELRAIQNNCGEFLIALEYVNAIAPASPI